MQPETMPLTRDEEERLTPLKATYPFSEWVDESIQFSRLGFLRWQVRRGDLGGPADGWSRSFPVEAFDSWVEEGYGQ
jgi:hypothetical protein